MGLRESLASLVRDLRSPPRPNAASWLWLSLSRGLWLAVRSL